MFFRVEVGDGGGHGPDHIGHHVGSGPESADWSAMAHAAGDGGTTDYTQHFRWRIEFSAGICAAVTRIGARMESEIKGVKEGKSTRRPTDTLVECSQ